MSRAPSDGAHHGISDERGVSDVVGYVLVFALVTATLTAVFAVGFVGLEERQNAERVENVERAFDVLDDNIRDIQRYEDPSRATEIRLSGGTMSLETHTTVVLEYENETTAFEERLPMSTLTYTNDETTLAYEGGAWFRIDGGRATMRSPPRFVAAGEQIVLPVVRLLQRDDQPSIRSDGTVQVDTETRGTRTLRYAAQDSEHVTAIRIESPYADAWKAHFEMLNGSEGGLGSDIENVSAPGDGEVVVDIEPDRTVYLRVIGVDVSLRE